MYLLPPEGSILQCIEEFEIILGRLKNENKILYIGGHFNINLLNFCGDNFVSQFVQLFISHNLYPTLNRPTRVSDTTNTLIDCLFTNFLGPATSEVIVDTLVSDHFPIILSSDFGIKPNKVPRVMSRRFTLDKAESFRTKLFTLFANFNHIACANTALNFFCKTIESEIDEFFPLYQRNRKVVPLRPWIDHYLLERINIKNCLCKEYIRDKCNTAFINFKSYRNKLKSDIRIAKCNYYHKLLDESKGNAKKSVANLEWNHLKNYS